MYQKKEKQIELISELLTQQMNHWMLFSLILTVLGGVSEFIDSGAPDILMWGCCGILPVLTFFVRARIKRFIPFVLCNLCILALTFIIPADNIACRILCILGGIGYFIHTFSLRLKSDSMFTTPFPPAVGIGFSVFGIFLLHRVSDKYWDSYYTFTIIGCFALYLIIYYINQYLRFLTVNESSSGNIPAAEIFHSGMKLVLGYTLAGTVFLFLGTNISLLERILGILKRGLLFVLRFLFSLLPDGKTEEPVSESLPASPAGNNLPELPPGETSLFWEILDTLFTAAFVCLLIFAAIRLLLFIIRYLRERFGLNFRQTQWHVADGNMADIREKCKLAKDKPVKEEHRFFGFLTPGERIRKLYKKKLLSAADKSIIGEPGKLSFYTAREAEAMLGTKGMAAIYEKARYSNSPVTVKDVKQMKEVL